METFDELHPRVCYRLWITRAEEVTRLTVDVREWTAAQDALK